MTDFDPDAYAAEESANWNGVAAAWYKWWPAFEGGSQHLNDRLVALAGVVPGHRVLDIATGLGEPALTAARVAGPTGQVTGCDLSSSMLAFAAERAAGAGLTQIVFREQNAEHLDVGSGVFDAAVCRWGLMLMGDPPAAARSVHAALRPEARFAAAVWCRPEDVPFIAIPGRVLREELDLPAPDPTAPGPFRMQDPDALPELLRAAGFEDITTERVPVTLEFDSATTYATFISEMSSSAGKVIRDTDEPTRRQLMAALAAAAQEFAGADGRLRLENHTICASGRRGGASRTTDA